MARKRKNIASDLVGPVIGILILLAYLNKSLVLSLLFWAIALIGVFLFIAGAVYFVRKFSGIKSNENPVATKETTSGGNNLEKHTNYWPYKNAAFNDANQPTSWSLDVINSLEWKRFEELCAEYYCLKGYKIKVTPLGADGGVDIYLYENRSPDKILGIVQCKAWTDKPVGVKEIRELYGVMTDIGCRLGVFITLKGFTKDAEQFSKGKHIILTDAPSLLKLIQGLSEPTQQVLLSKMTDGDFRTPSCPNCGIKLVSRKARGSNSASNEFWGCSNFPRCRYTMRMKK